MNTTCLLVLINASTKYYQNISNILKDLAKKLIQGRSLEKKTWQMLSLLHVTRLLFDTNASTKYYQNMSKGIKVMDRTRFWLQGTKKKLRVVSLACDMPTGPPLHLYQILPYYLKQYGSDGLHKISASGRQLHNKESESCLPYTRSSSSLPNIIKLSQTVWEL